MTKKPDIDAGRVLAELPRRGGTEVIRLAVRTFNGKAFLDARLWWRDADTGPWLPSKKGVMLRGEELDAVVEALEAAKPLMPAPTARPAADARGQARLAP